MIEKYINVYNIIKIIDNFFYFDNDKHSYVLCAIISHNPSRGHVSALIANVLRDLLVYMCVLHV